VVSTSPPSWQPRRRLLAIALFVSLVANLFLGGLTVGWMLHLDRWPWQSSYVTEFGSQAGRAVEHLIRNLDSADRDMVVDSIRAHGDELSQYARAIREQRETVKKLLRAPDFDRKAAEEAFAKMRRLTDDMQAALGKAILEAVEKLPPQARQRMAD
jgi:Predicted integral membrane protein